MYTKILVGLDGSEPSRFAGRGAIALAKALGSHVTACHVYGIDIHKRRFSDMEPGLPKQYQEEQKLTYLRSSHDKLMLEGFRALSTGYVEDFVNTAVKLGIPVESAAVEGRSYTGILQLADKYKSDLIILGANGIGAIGDGLLGGTMTRVLYNAACDMLVTRCDMNDGSILTGVDGSDEAIKAVEKAGILGKSMKKKVRVLAAYDPVFHVRVFDTVASTFSTERQEEVGLAEQEKLHNDIINEGLGKLYSEFLLQAKERFGEDGDFLTTTLATGKAYDALNAEAEKICADLIVVGRHGNHRQPGSIVGSNAENLLRITKTNVLITGGVAKTSEGKSEQKEDKTDVINKTESDMQSLVWEGEAQDRLKKVPFFARGMAKRAVENAIIKTGKRTISAADFDNIAAQFGMGKKK